MKNNNFIRNCPECGANFEYLSPNKKYCSAKCSNKKQVRRYKGYREKALLKGIVHGRPLNEHFYLRYKKGAEKKGNSFDLSQEQFNGLMGGYCYYCGDEIQYVGIDRLDNNMGYSDCNCVRCCTFCNLMKRAKPVGEFIGKCKKIAEIHK